ncbi:hypothetical protein FP2506_06251 [Fulvimarina pelagi HTCC2506]|uniref:Flippase-like domain-containing protein n=2 Tax=Fulvimarina pelagi TaxID=217511 RepID=Q0G7E6_9HYPH|nr:hypothetical protein FP2506_06251 [Fulvimarina pelagi HTCC2506]
MFLRVLVPVVLFTGLLAVVDLGKALTLIAGASPVPLIAALVLVQVQIILAAVRWRVTARSLGQRLSMSRAIKEYYGASLLNLILPGGVSGDVVRVARNRSDQNGVANMERSAHAVILERASGQFAFVAVAAAGLGIWAVNGGEGAPDEAVLGVKTLGVIIAAVIGALAVTAIFARGPIAAALKRFVTAARLAFLQPRQALYQLVLSLALVAAYLAVFALASLAVSAPLDLRQVLLFVPPVLLTMVLPISIGGWGLRETAAAALWPLAGYAPSIGIAASVLYGLVSTVGALPGLFAFDFPLPHFFRRRRSRGEGDYNASPSVTEEDRRA